MKNNNNNAIVSVLLLLGILGLTFYSMIPHGASNEDVSLSEFSTQRAFEQVQSISQKPHYVGSENHDFVANYLAHELQRMGLETAVQEGSSFADGTLTHCKNVLARIKGSNSEKAVLLLSHYDSAPHSGSYGASDAGSGVATILESIRAFIYNKQKPKNDIIILFSDAEELSLNGASLFVNQHPWAKDVGVVLNFEARGSAGPSYMLMETNSGNAGLVKEFAKAKTKYPIANSLMYSIYKMLPNDTDLTIFRENGNIQGYNFAFIDGHYNYHTAQDDSEHLDKNSLMHQGKHLMPLLDYFSNADLKQTQSTQDEVYFTIPYTFISYPYEWVLPMFYIALVLFFILTLVGIGKRLLSIEKIATGFFLLLLSLIISGFITHYGWIAILQIYPQYKDLLNGFTYNGSDYIAAFTLLSLSICFAVYQLFPIKKEDLSYYTVPLLIWVVINGFIAYSLQGAGFLIIPVFSGLLMLASYVITQKSNWLLNLVLSLPTVFIIVPFIELFPIGLGLNILYGSAILTVLSFGLLLPILGSYHQKGIASLVLLILSIGFFAKANYNAEYEEGKAKSNSLVYILDVDSNKAKWATYDTNLDYWTKSYLGQNPKEDKGLNSIPLESKYNSKFTFATETTIKEIAKPSIEFLKDTIIRENRYLKFKITPNRKVNRYDVFANADLVVHNFKANGLTLLNQKGSKHQINGRKLIRYYVVNDMPLEIEFSVPKASILDLELMESSFDLMSNPLFSMQKRANWMMPTPFVLNDAVIIKQKIKPIVKRKPIIDLNLQNSVPNDSINQQ